MHLSHNGRYTGPNRIYTIFNHTNYRRNENVEILIWDYYQGSENISIHNSKNEDLTFHTVGNDYNQYWGHWYTKLVINVDIPKLGYETIIISNDCDKPDLNLVPSDSRLSTYNDYSLENDLIKVSFDETSMDIVSIIDKRTNMEMLGGPSNLRFIKEETTKGNAWVVGDYMSVDDCDKEVTNRKVTSTSLYKEISFSMLLSKSNLEITYRLSHKNDFIEINILNRFNDLSNEKYIPQIQYRLNLDKNTDTFTYDIPMSVHNRTKLREDVCGLTFGLANVMDNYGIYFGSDSKYGYRANEDYFALNIIRNTPGPNTNPEVDTHYTDFIIGVGSKEDAYKNSAFLNHPVDVVNAKPNNDGKLNMCESIFDISSNCILSSIKTSEDNDNEYIFKFYEINGINENIKIKFLTVVKKAAIVDVLEQEISDVGYRDNEVNLIAKPYKLVMVKVGL